MKNILFVSCLMYLLASCETRSGSGDLVKQTRNLKGFTSISAAGGMHVEIAKGNNETVVVEADDNVIEDVETVVENGQLKISMENGFSFSDVHIKIFITAPVITKISSAASADIIVAGVLESDNKIMLNASSGSSIKAELNAPQAAADASSGAEIDVTGKTKTFDVQASSGAAVDAFELLSEDTFAAASSGGKVDVHASVKLDAKASSGGSVSYRGPATAVTKESSGGSIKKDN